MGKREAQFVTLRELREEVGNDAAGSSIVMRSTTSSSTSTSSSRSRSSNDNPVYYIQYAHARVASVLKQLGRTRAAVRSRGAALRRSRRSTGHERSSR